MKTIKHLVFLCVLLALAPAYAGFTEASGLRWELPPGATKNVHADALDAVCRSFMIGSRPSRLPTYDEVTVFERTGRNALSEDQKTAFEATRNAAGQNWPTAEFEVMAKNGATYWRAGLRSRAGNRALKPDDFHNLVICVGDTKPLAGAPKKSSDAKDAPPAPAKTSKAVPSNQGPVLTRVENTKQPDMKKLTAEAVERNKKEAADRSTKRKADQAAAATAQAAKDEKAKQRCLATPALRGSCGCMKYFPDAQAKVCGK